MTIELNLLKALSVKENLEKYTKLLNPKTLSLQTIELLKQYQEYFKVYITDTEVSFSKFTEFFFIIRHPTMDERQASNYKQIIDEVSSVDIEDRHVLDIIKAFETQEFYAVLHQDLDRNVNIGQLQTKIQEYGQKMALLDEDMAVEANMSLSEALKETDRSTGLRWRLPSLNQAIGGLIKSDFVVFSAYVGKGKTSFLASECSYMAEQLRDDQKVLWFNNEGNWKKILSRVYCATLGCTEEDLRKHQDRAVMKYGQKMHDLEDRIKIIDIKGKSIRDIEKTIKDNNTGLIIIDMLDKVRGFEIYLKGESGLTERFNQLYAWAEEMSDIAPVIATSQLNGDGCNEPYPLMTNLRGSRVDKQGNASTMIIMGAMEGNTSERYLSTPKNKISGNEAWRQMVKFDSLRSRFSD